MKSPTLSLFVLGLASLLAGCAQDREGQIQASGTLEAIEVRVSSKVAGQVERMLVREGSEVKVGDTLVVLDRKTLELQWRQAQAGVDLADAQYKLLLNGARSEDLQLAEEGVRQAEAHFKTANDDFHRMKELFATKSVSQKQLDDAESRYIIAQAQLNSARQTLKKLKDFARPEEIAAAKARLEQARVAAELLRKQWMDAVIVAPVSGTVTQKPVEVGELAATGSPVTTITQLDNMELMIYVNEVDLGKVNLGDAADVVIDTYPDRTFHGTVVYISPVAEFTPKNVQTKEDRTKLVYGVKLQVQNVERILKSGMPADAYLK
jgi:HlyD family secretion protein